MTPELLTALAALLLEARDWCEELEPGSLDVALIDGAVDAIGRLRIRTIRDGAS